MYMSWTHNSKISLCIKEVQWSTNNIKARNEIIQWNTFIFSLFRVRLIGLCNKSTNPISPHLKVSGCIADTVPLNVIMVLSPSLSLALCLILGLQLWKTLHTILQCEPFPFPMINPFPMTTYSVLVRAKPHASVVNLLRKTPIAAC